MKKVFDYGSYIARRKIVIGEVDKWYVYRYNIFTATINEEGDEVKFVDPDCSHAIDDLNDISNIMKEIKLQYWTLENNKQQ